MPVQTPIFYHNGKVVSRPIVVTGSVTTNVSGIARIYWTDNGLSTGNSIFKQVNSWSTDVVANVPVDSRATQFGSNWVEITVTRFSFTGTVILGIPVLGTVANTPTAGVQVMFTIIGT